MFVDSHCHLDFPELSAELPALLEAMSAARVTHALCISVNLPDWPRVHDLALAIMRDEGARDAGGVMHCFTETWDVAQAALDLGFHISLSGIVTFKNAHALKDVARRVPLDRLLIETDSPYLAPVPFRGKRNQPAFVPYVAAEIARLRGLPLEEVARATTSNFFRLFAIEPGAMPDAR
jgi:Tat protein secretion system quality control protein TatD with DNase activity